MENYVETYIPVKIEHMIIENMRLVLSEDDMTHLRSEENKLYSSLQNKLLETEPFSEGTIFETITHTNKLMAKALGLRVDLRKEKLVESGENVDEDKAVDQLKQKEDQLDTYIGKFMALNLDNANILKK